MNDETTIRFGGPWSRLSLGLSLAVAVVLGALLFFGAQPAFGASYVVDTTANDSGETLTACTVAAGDCSLRGAVKNANTNAGADVITFSPSVFPPATQTNIVFGTSGIFLTDTGDTINGTGAGVGIDGTSALAACVNVLGDSNVIVSVRAIFNCGSGAISVSGSGNTIGGINQAEMACANGADDDSDSFINDGCAASGAREIGAECSDGLDNDGDVLIEDGCPRRGQGIRIANSVIAIQIGAEAADGNVIIGNHIGVTADLTTDAGGTEGIQIASGADSTVVGGATAGESNLISGYAYGVSVFGSGTTGTVIRGNLIGLNGSGTGTVANDYGVYLWSSSSGTTVGGTNAAEVACGADTADDDSDGYINDGCVQVLANAETGANCANATDDDLVDSDGAINDGCPARGSGNVISGNTFNGINLLSGSTGNVIKGNFIGTNAAGTGDLGNGARGMEVETSSNTIGGTASGDRNVVSGNNDRGIAFEGAGVSGNVVQGNYIGVGADGVTSLGNTQQGIWLGSDTGGGETIGGTAAGAGNLISENGAQGIGALTNGHLIQGNTINDNDLVGVYLNSSGNTVGGTVSGARNVISQNGTHGVHITGSGVSGNMVVGNFIGLNASGTAGNANGGDGVLIDAGATSNTIGGTNAAEVVCSGSADDDSDGFPNDGCPVSGYAEGSVLAGGYGANCSDADNDDSGEDSLVNDGCPPRGSGNVISGNLAYGVAILGSGSNSNTVAGNVIGSNADTNLTALGNGSGNVFVGMSAQNNTIGGSTTGHMNLITGTDGVGSDHGIEVVGSDTSGNAIKGNTIGLDYTGGVEMHNAGNGIYIGAPSTTVGGTTVGERNIVAANALAQLRIDGAAATGNVVLGNLLGTSCCGQWGGGSAVEISGGASGNTIGGSTTSARNIISGSGGHGVHITGTGTSSNVVKANYIGTNVPGTAAIANNSDGVRIDAGATGNTVGGSTVGERNVISGNTGDGVEVNGASSTGNVVKGNYIGTDATGTADISAQSAGVRVVSVAATIGGAVGVTPGGNCTGECNLISGNGTGINTSGAVTVKGNYIGTNVTGAAALGNSTGMTVSGAIGSVIGGTTAAEGNVISSNTGGYGVDLMGAHSTVIQGNYIGTNAAGAVLGNAGGIEVDSGSSTATIGGTATGAANVIANNAADGVFLQSGSGTGSSIRGNSIYANTELAIDIFPNGVTANDVDDVDTGPNNVMNFPANLAASYNGFTSTFTVTGTLDTGSATSARVDVYATDVVDLSANGEGRQYLGTATPIDADPGNWTMTSTGLPLHGYISATATDTSGNGSTSEFSLTLDADIDGDGFVSSLDNCDVNFNHMQIDHDLDGIGDACDSVVRNRFTATQSSLVYETTYFVNDPQPVDNRNHIPWDYQPGGTVPLGAIVGSNDVNYGFMSDRGICGIPVRPGIGGTPGPVTLYNASLDNSSGNLVSFAGSLVDANANGIVDGAEKYPSWLNTILDPKRQANIDEDGDGLTDEDGPNGVNTDGDMDPNSQPRVDEDGPGSPAVPFSRAFGTFTTYGAPTSITVLIFEEVPNQLYRSTVIYGDPTLQPAPGAFTACTAAEYRATTLSTSVDNPGTGANEGGATILNTPTSGSKVFKVESVPAPDTDGDGVDNYEDNCRLASNSDQADSDIDGIGNTCEPASGPCFAVSTTDCDGDGSYNITDNCPLVANASQAQSELRTPLPFGVPQYGDRIGDACDPNPTIPDMDDETVLVSGQPVGNPMISVFSDPVCVTGSGVTDADGDGWCADGVGATVTTGTQPNGVAVNSVTNRIYVANGVSDTLSVIDGFTDTELTEFLVGNGPAGVGVNTRTNRVYVANLLDGNLKIINGATNAITNTLSVGTSPRSVAVNEETNRIYVTNQGSNSVSVIDGYTNAEIDTDGNSGNGITRITVGNSPAEIAVNTQTNRIYVANQSGGTLSVIDGGANAVLSTIPLGVSPTGVAVQEDTGRVYVSNFSSANVSVVDGATNTEVDTDGNSGNGMTRIAVGSQPNHVELSRHSNRVFVSNFGGSNVSVIDPSTNTEFDTDGNSGNGMTRLSVGTNPEGVGSNPVTGRVYVANSGGTTVSVIGEGSDPNASSATVTPERVGAFGSCTNGVDDDGAGGTDFADAHCADADGDRVPDAADTCPQAADPLQLDEDGNGQGDACEAASTSSLDIVSTTNAANSELRNRLVEVAPKPLHKSDGIVNFIDPDFAVTGGGSVPNGAVRAAITSMITVAIDPNPAAPSTTTKTCNSVVPANFTLLDASIDPSDTIAPGTNFAALLADTAVANGLADGVDKFPAFLRQLAQTSAYTDNDGDLRKDEDPPDGADNDQDALVDEDGYDPVTPLARMFGSVNFQGASHVLNVLVYPNGMLPLVAVPAGIVVVLVFDDPTAPTASGNVVGTCSHQDHRLFQYGVALDNALTGANEGGARLITNDSSVGTEAFSTRLTSQADIDLDGIENFLDACTFQADNDHDGTSDATDPVPWNPRLVAPPGDPDLDGLPTACDRPEDLAPATGECADAADNDYDVKVNDGCPTAGGSPETGTQCDNATNDDPGNDSLVNDGCPARGDPNVANPPGSGNDGDGDHVADQTDRCETVFNPAPQADTDGDGIGDVCDPAPTTYSGTQQSIIDGDPRCTGTGAVDEDQDGYCFGLDPDDDPVDDDENPTGSGDVVPEEPTFEPILCADHIDNNGINGIDLQDPGCVSADYDSDGVMNTADNCPGLPPASAAANYNPYQPGTTIQADSDGDGTVNRQPYARSAADNTTPDPGHPDPYTVMGTPYARSDLFGGDVCDPDDDGDKLADDSEPATCPADVLQPIFYQAPHHGKVDADCDDDLLIDLPEWTFPACLNITVNNNDSALALPQFKTFGNQDHSTPTPDYLFTYGEALIGTDPCNPNGEADSANDQDNDGYRSAPERYLGTNKGVRCGAGFDAGPSSAWPSDFVSGGIPLSTDKITITDLTSFIAPTRKLDTRPGNLTFNKRWDVVPGNSIASGPTSTYINISDLTAMFSGTSGFPPMFGGAKALGYPTPCNDPP